MPAAEEAVTKAIPEEEVPAAEEEDLDFASNNSNLSISALASALESLARCANIFICNLSSAAFRSVK